jgi:enoyl-CoA hydratase
MTGDGLHVGTDGKVAILTLDRAADGNALTKELARALARELLVAERDPRVAVVVLTGSDPAFCAGLDPRQVANETFDYSLMVDPRRSPWKILAAMRTPTIAAVNGLASTGGLGLALMCSFAIASERAAFGENYAAVLRTHPMAGLVSLLAQAIGVRRARELSFTGDRLGATEAYERGLVNHVVPHDLMMPFSLEVAGRIAANDQATVALLNDLYRNATLTTLGDSLGREERGFQEREMDPKRVLEQHRSRIWSEPFTARS